MQSHYNTLSLFSLKAGGRQVDDIFVAVSIVICRSTNCGATGGAVSLTIFCFSELDYHDIQTRFYCDTYIIGMYMISLYNRFYALIIYLPYHCSIRFLFSLRAGGLRAGGFFVPDGTVSCHYDDLWCRWWRRGCGLDDHLFSVLD